MDCSSRNFREGLSDRQLTRSEHDQQSDILDQLAPAPSWMLGYHTSPDIYPQAFLRRVEPFVSSVCETAPGYGGPLCGAYSIPNSPRPFRSSTFYNPSTSYHSLFDVTADGSTSRSRATTLPVTSNITYPIYSPPTGSIFPIDCLASDISSQGPTYADDLSLSPQDGPPLPSGEEIGIHGDLAAFEFSEPPDHSAGFPPPSHPVVSDAALSRHSAEVANLTHAPVSLNLKQLEHVKHKEGLISRKLSFMSETRDPRAVSPRFRAQLSEGASVSYGDGCRLDHVMLRGKSPLLTDYNAMALPGQTFGQKVSFHFEFEGYEYTRQHHVLLRGGQPTKRRLAQVAFSFMNYFINDCQKRGQPVRFSLEHLVLRRIDVISRSAIRPVFDFVVLAS